MIYHMAGEGPNKGSLLKAKPRENFVFSPVILKQFLEICLVQLI